MGGLGPGGVFLGSPHNVGSSSRKQFKICQKVHTLETGTKLLQLSRDRMLDRFFLSFIFLHFLFYNLVDTENAVNA